MEVGRNLLSSSPSFPPKTHLRNSLSSYSSSSSCSSSASASTSVLLLEQRDDFKALLRLSKEDKTSQGVLNKRRIESEPSVGLDEKSLQDLWELDRPSTHWPDSLHITQSPQRKDINDELSDAIALAKKALMASKEAASIDEFFEDADSCSDDDVDEIPPSLASSVGKESETVKSTRLFERRSKRRKSPKSTLLFPTKQSAASRVSEVRKKVGEGVNSGDPIRFFLAGPESKQLLTSDEESQLISRVQDLMKLEQVKARVQSEIGREPTLVEWAEALGLSCQSLRAQIRSGASAREKLVYSNLRMVVHVAKQYRGRGLGIQDLMQEGSMGLMRSVEKFKPQAGCRFASYAYWWIRQAIRKAIFQHSRTIRISENMYTLLGKVSEAKKAFRREGNHKPLHEDVAVRVGITNEKLAKLLFAARTPLSMQQTVWADQNVTFQEVTADTSIEVPEMSVTKQLMRKQVRGLIRILDPRDQHIIELRFGIEDGQRKSLSEIGTIYGLTKERVRQLESRALSKLKERFIAQDFDAYSNVLM